MSLRYRLAFYLLGLTIGIIFVYYFLTAKAESRGVSFCYLPNCRVLKELRSKPLEISNEAQKEINEKWVTIEDIKISLTHGDVDFSKSNKPANGGKLYVIEGKTKNDEEITIEMLNFEKKVLLKDIIKTK